ncbi:methyltransferase type 11 [Lucifera butyrica]|uniref:Methyltransferase type 11 n=1 Tax=Lucifera butyrica TaxID=1351585 RepID=A0A498R8R3_9FIRM|nr:class I SAM-dependent methyltransferase [Lucifera butyrica]VBB05518.1 methyltransferase type 11 [Lucifera butyrica]
MDTYLEPFMINANKHLDFYGKIVLEIGCGNGKLVKEIAGRYSPHHIVGVDPGLESWWGIKPSKRDNWEIANGDAINLNYPDNFFDAVVSIATFEHIADLSLVLSEIRRVLKPFGRFYTEFSPVWTSIIGHHYFFWNEDKAGLIPPWGHLWMARNEMHNYLLPKIGEKEAEAACFQIYDSDIINRLTRSDYYRIFLNSGFWIREIRESMILSRYIHLGKRQSELTPEIYNNLIRICEKEKLNELAVGGFSVFFEKYANI